MQIPGFAWTAALALIPLLINWLGGDYFVGQSWVPWAVVVLGAVAKFIALYREQRTPASRAEQAMRTSPLTTEPLWVRFLIG